MRIREADDLEGIDPRRFREAREFLDDRDIRVALKIFQHLRRLNRDDGRGMNDFRCAVDADNRLGETRRPFVRRADQRS